MSYKWKPSASQRRAFAEKMKDPAERTAYETRKRERAEKRRGKSRFDYEKAGGEYIPTKAQHDFCLNLPAETTPAQLEAANMILYGYGCLEKVHHDYIHIINDMIRAKK
jgi:hypothetical protein